METLLPIKLAGNVAQFIDFATAALSTAHKLDASHKSPVEFDEGIDNLINALLERTSEVHFQVPDGVILLSEVDEIFRRLSNECKKVSSRLLADLKHFKAIHNQGNGEYTFQPLPTRLGQNDSDNFQLQLNVIREDLNEKLAPRQWLIIKQMIRELAAKNIRLNASRTKDIVELKSEIDASFRQIKLKEVDDTKKSTIWSQVLMAVHKATGYAFEQVILSSLHFWTMNRRQELISKEHENTFEWILERDPSENQPQPAVNFVDWLVKDEPVYWISGKPGSGKSTIMKFIAESPKTRDGLKQWAGDDKLITASFYFWSSAKDPLQKSGTGLLRSILFQILRQCPELIQNAFADHWQGYKVRDSIKHLGLTESTTAELLAAYQRIADLLQTMEVKFCFFIDGLDEYEGQSSDIILLVETLRKTPNLKTCISSRQWNEFETSFGGRNPWKLYVHQLTQNDMTLYVEDLLSSDQRFCKLKEADGEGRVQALVTNIVQNAEGVFLWVFLVVRSLLDGLTDTDRIVDLQQKLATMPNDLEKHFEKMLLNIDERFREQTAHNFLITLYAAEKLPLMCYWFIQENSLDSVLKIKLESLPKKTALSRLKQMAKQLDIYSTGLLKATGMGPDPPSELEEHQWLFEFQVDFLHRTVADFLQLAQMQQLLKKWSAESFNADLEISKASLATIKITPPKEAMFRESPRFLASLHLFLTHAKLLGNRTPEESQTALVDELVSSLNIHNETLSDIKEMILGPGNYWVYQCSFNFAILYHCVSYGLGEYVCLQLDRGLLQFPEPASGLLSGCLSWDPRVRRGKLTLDFDTSNLLLRRHLDPNMPWGDRNLSFWQQLLNTTYSSHLRGIMTQVDYDAIECTIDHGADLEAEVEIISSSRINTTRATEILEKVLPKEQFSALQISNSFRKVAS